MGRISGFQQFPEFLETFWENFYTICRCFQIFESFSGKAAQGYLNMFRCSRKFFSATTQKVVCPLLNFQPETFYNKKKNNNNNDNF